MKLSQIQTELKAPKSQFNKFGNYNYRNCEDILEALKPLLIKYKCYINITDDIVLIGDRYYVKSTATIFDCDTKDKIASACGFAREEENKKGMDQAQLTGSTSSYARKYALNGLFAIDDTKDADALPPTQNEQKKAYSKATPTNTQSTQRNQNNGQNKASNQISATLTRGEYSKIQANEYFKECFSQALDGKDYQSLSQEEKEAVTKFMRNNVKINQGE